LNKLVFLPFVNELDYPDGAMILAENFIGSMRQKHPNITILAPQGAKQLIQDQKPQRSLPGFHGAINATTGVATMSFLSALLRMAKLMASSWTDLGFGVIRETTVFGGFFMEQEQGDGWNGNHTFAHQGRP